jgi:hypothetical protein
VQSYCALTEAVLELIVTKIGDKYLEERINVKYLFTLGKTNLDNILHLLLVFLKTKLN